MKILYPPKLSTYQFFMQDFVNQLAKSGVEVVDGLAIPWKIRLLVAKSRISFHLPLSEYLNKDILLVPCAGYPDSFVWPYSYFTRFVPILWDCWPRYWERIIASFKRHHVTCAFFTSSQVAEMVKHELPAIQTFHLPEGICAERYRKGALLKERTIDILEFGRTLEHVHQILVESSERNGFRHEYQRAGAPLLFSDFNALTKGLSDSKITVCYPRCDTNPEMAGSVETLTQRYWECMLSRTVMIGRAPKELVSLIGYDPVVSFPTTSCADILTDIILKSENYQALVDKNYETALQFAPWRQRIPYLLDCLTSCGIH